MTNKRRQRTEFEKAVWAGVCRALQDPEIQAARENAGTVKGHSCWTDPQEGWRLLRMRIAQHVVADLKGEMMGQADYPDQLTRDWKAYQQQFGKATLNEVYDALPFREQRDKREVGHRTDIESLVENALRQRAEPYQFEASIGHISVDFALPARRIVIECDGEHWHSADRFNETARAIALEALGWEAYNLRFTKSDVNQNTANIWVNEILDGSASREGYRLSSPVQPPEIQKLCAFLRAQNLVSDGKAKVIEEWMEEARDHRKIQLPGGKVLHVTRPVSQQESERRRELLCQGVPPGPYKVLLIPGYNSFVRRD